MPWPQPRSSGFEKRPEPRIAKASRSCSRKRRWIDSLASQNSLAFDLSDITDDQFFEQAEAKVIEALRQYAEKAQNGQRLQRRLFTEDAVRGFAFVDLCHKRFDVVLMNPPFGDVRANSKGLIEKQYPRTKNDLYAAFVERGIGAASAVGCSERLLHAPASSSRRFRNGERNVLLNEATPTVFCDLGYGVLDTAMVETAAYCLEVVMNAHVFLRLLTTKTRTADFSTSTRHWLRMRDRS